MFHIRLWKTVSQSSSKLRLSCSPSCVEVDLSEVYHAFCMENALKRKLIEHRGCDLLGKFLICFICPFCNHGEAWWQGKAVVLNFNLIKLISVFFLFLERNKTSKCHHENILTFTLLKTDAKNDQWLLNIYSKLCVISYLQESRIAGKCFFRNWSIFFTGLIVFVCDEEGGTYHQSVSLSVYF